MTAQTPAKGSVSAVRTSHVEIPQPEDEALTVGKMDDLIVAVKEKKARLDSLTDERDELALRAKRVEALLREARIDVEQAQQALLDAAAE